MKLQMAGTAKGLNVEHRTSNIERRILMTLRFIYFKTSEPQNVEVWFRFAQSFKNRQNTLLRYSTFIIRYSLFQSFTVLFN
jgi:hypothetical protein